MITLANEPETYSGINNPVWLRAETDGMWQTTGYKAEYSFPVAVGTIVATDYFEFVVNGVTYRFDMVAGVAGEGEISVTGLTGAILVAEFAKDRNLGNWFTITFVPGIPDTVEFVAKDYGADYNMTAEFNGISVGSQTTAGVDWVRKNGFRLLMDVEIEGESGVVGTYEPIPATDYTDVWADFFIENVLKPYLKTQPPKAGNTGLLTTEETVRKYTCTVFEKSVGTDKINYYARKDVTSRWAWNGGVDWDKWPSLKAALSTDYFTQNTGRKFLSMKPKQSYIRRNEEQYVYFWCEKESGTNSSLNAQWTVYYKDGTNEVETLVYAAVENKVAIVPAYLDIITGLSQSLDNVLRMRLVLSHTMSVGGPVSSEAWVWDVLTDVPYKTYVQIKNSMGGYDSWAMSGGAEHAKETLGEMTAAPLADGYLDTVATPYPATMGTDGKVRLEQKRSMKLNSGWLNKEHAEWMMNELGSSLLVHEDDRLVEWVVANKVIAGKKDDGAMQEIEITIEQAFVTNRN